MEFNPVIESEFNPIIDYIQRDIIEGLLKTSTLEPERIEYIYRTLDLLSYDEATKLIELLNGTQINRIHAGLNYNATYIKQFMKESI